MRRSVLRDFRPVPPIETHRAMASVTRQPPALRPLCVFLLEDDLLLRDRILVPHLRQFGFDVRPFGSGAELERALDTGRPDMVVIDAGLPDRDGFEMTRQLHARLPLLGIVMLTARGDNLDRVRALTGGADAYLTKPVDMDVLTATLYSLARRLRPASSPVSEMSGWRLDADGWCLMTAGGGLVPLTRTERRLLTPLMENPNKVITRDDLIGMLAPDDRDFDTHRLDSLIHRLRRKVRNVVGENLPLKAVHGEGYVLVQI